MPLDILETDFLGDLSSDTHGVWEIFEFARLHYPGCEDAEIFKIGSEYLMRWIECGWIRVADKPLYPTQVASVDDVRRFVQKHGVAATFYIEGSPSLDIAEAGLLAYQKEPNQAIQPTPGQCPPSMQSQPPGVG